MKIRMDDDRGFERLEREFELERDRDKEESVVVDWDFFEPMEDDR